MYPRRISDIISCIASSHMLPSSDSAWSIGRLWLRVYIGRSQSLTLVDGEISGRGFGTLNEGIPAFLDHRAACGGMHQWCRKDAASQGVPHDALGGPTGPLVMDAEVGDQGEGHARTCGLLPVQVDEPMGM